MQATSFKQIGLALGKDPTTIAKEIKKHATIIPFQYNRARKKCNDCIFWADCNVRGTATCMSACPNHRVCKAKCNRCWDNHRNSYCSAYIRFTCNKPQTVPYVCNACPSESSCHLEHKVYQAKRAQQEYEKTLSKSRKGINMTPEELQELNDLISPLVLKGQPLSHIFAVHADEIPVCRRTLYNYFDQSVFNARNIDLPRRVRYKKRKSRPEPKSKSTQQLYRNKRTYIDFEKYTKAFPELNVVEMDTVKGSRAAGKCLLTLLFRSCSFMIIILLPDCTQRSVINAINELCNTLGIRTFKKYFPIILTDNGSEFKNPWDIEKTESGVQRCKVFYCDPYISNQKGRLEKNHEYIRYVIPKGRSMYKYTQEDINLLASHINSTARDSLNGTTPFDLAELLLDKKIPLLTGQHKVSPDSVMLKPVLLNHRDQ